MKKRLYLLIGVTLAALCAVVLLVGYFSAAAAPADRIPIRWFVGLGTGSNPDQVLVQQQVVDTFNASQTAISLTLEVYPYAEAANVLMQQLRTGNQPDIVGPVGINGANYFSSHWLDLSDIISDTAYDLSDYDPSLMDLFSVGGSGVSGLPISIYPSFIYYNGYLFNNASLAHPPHQYGQPYSDPIYGGAWNVDKLEEIARLLTLDNIGRNANDPFFDDDNIIQYGYLETYGQLTAQASLFGPGSFANTNGDAQIPLLWEQAITWYYQGMWEDHFIPNYPNANSYPGGNPFNDAKLAMSRANSWFNCCVNNIGDFEIAATPSYSGSITANIDADTFRIIKYTQHPIEAFTVLDYLTSVAAPTLNGTYNGFPARTSLRSGALFSLHVRFPFADWQVLLDSIDYLDNPNHEGYLPNYAKAADRIQDFQDLYGNTPGLNIHNALEDLKDDLQIIFHERSIYLPWIVK